MTEKLRIPMVLREGGVVIVTNKAMLYYDDNITKSMQLEEDVEYIIVRG